MESRLGFYIFLVLWITLVSSDEEYHWGYYGNSGPITWKDHYDGCAGQSQSPIDVPHESGLEYNSDLEEFTFTGYDLTNVQMKVLNNGHTAQVNIETGVVEVSGGGLGGHPYRAVQFHFHWGSDNGKGSEHTFRGHEYPMEVHIVHYNTKYNSLVDALGHADGLAVLGFWFEVSDTNNTNYNDLISALSHVGNKGQDHSMGTGMKMNQFLPSMVQKDEYIRYNGSLTTPGCNEIVTWTLFLDTIPISSQQLSHFRMLREMNQTHGEYIVNNFRPVQPLNGRTVQTSFQEEIIEAIGGHWGYHGNFAPANWPLYYEDCAGDRQSPIDVPAATAEYDASLGTFKFNNYDTTDNFRMKVKNNGHSVQADLEGSTEISIENGGLSGKYVAAQFHYHWGSDSTKGSEHTVDGKKYPMELHIVHFKKSYGSLANAINKTDGLAVLGFFFVMDPVENNTFYEPLIDKISDVKYKGSNTILNGVKLSSMLPDQDIGSFQFNRYLGSLTTPTCNEAVIWSVFYNKIPISEYQLSQFRKVLEIESGQPTSHDYIVNNYRPPVPRGSRKVTVNVQLASAPRMVVCDIRLLVVVFCAFFVTKFS